MDENIILDKTLDFSVKLVDYCKILEKKRAFPILNQVMKSGTSIGAQVREAQNPESRLDFIHKFKIAAKEVEELEYWFALCRNSDHLPNPGKLEGDLKEIAKIINSIITTSKSRLKKPEEESKL